MRPLIFCCLGLAVLRALAFGQGAVDRHITLSLPATRLVNLLPLLSEASGMKLEAAGQVKDQVVLLHVRDVPTSVLMAQIAKTCLATWVQKDGRYVLSRSVEEKAMLVADEAARRAAALQKSLQAQKAEDTPFGAAKAKDLMEQILRLGEFKPVGESERKTWGLRMGAIMHKMPIEQLLTRIVRSLDPADLLRLPPGITVFSTQPTRMQRSLGLAGSKAFDAFRAEQGVWSGEMAKLPGGAPILHTDNEVNTEFWSRPIGRDAVCQIKLWRSLGLASDLFQFDLRVTAGGRTIIRTSRQISVDLAPSSQKPVEALRPLLTDGRDVEFDPSVVRLVRALTAKKDPFTPLKVPLDIQTLAADPENHDPLAWSGADGLRSVAKMHGLNLVAWVPDRQFNLLYLLDEERLQYGPRPNVSSYTQRWMQSEILELGGDGWLTSRPADPATTLDTQDSRPVMGRVLRLVRKIVLPTLDDFADAIGDDPLGITLLANHWQLVQPSFSGSAEIVRLSPELRRLYHSFPVLTRRNLLQGGSIRASQMTVAQRELLQSSVMRGFTGYTWLVDGSGEKLPYDPSATPEPTQEWPNGIPGDTVFTLTQTPVPMLGLISNAPAQGREMMVSLNVMAAAFDQAATGKKAEALQYSLYQPIVLRNYEFHLEGPGPLRWSYGFGVYERAAPAPVKLADLPAGYQQIIDSLRHGGLVRH